MEENIERVITIVAQDTDTSGLLRQAIDSIKSDNNISIVESKKKEPNTLLTYCTVNGYMPYMGSPRRRDSLSQEEQLRKIALAQLKRERKLIKKGKTNE